MDLRNKKVEKMERLLKDKDEQSLDADFCKKLASSFNHSNGRAGKPVVKWNEVLNWFQTQPPVSVSEEGAESEATESTEIFRAVREACSLNGKRGNRRNGKNVPEMKLEAKSSKDSAWYDVDHFVQNRRLDSPAKDLAEVLVRFATFKKDQDEWVKVKNAIRKQSIPLKASECHLVEIGESALHYLKEEEGAAGYFDVTILGIKRKTHDVRGCRCIFTIRYIRDNSKKDVMLGSLYFRPSILDS